MKQTFKIMGISLVNIVLFSAALFASTELQSKLRESLPPTPLESVRWTASVGRPRDKVIASLSDEAWYYQTCESPYPNITTDLFFYDNHDYDQADIVVVHYLLSDEGIFEVSSASTCAPADWQALYGDCIDRSRFDD